MISVPDLTTVFQLYLQPNITLSEKWLLTRVIYGAQTDKYDFHHNGFDEAMLTYFLQFLFLETNEQQAQRPAAQPTQVLQAFCDIERVNSFNLFSDSSEIVMHGKKISLNLAARRCPTAQDTPQERSFRIEMNATPYVPMEFPQPEICHACKKEKNAKTQGKLKV